MFLLYLRERAFAHWAFDRLGPAFRPHIAIPPAAIAVDRFDFRTKLGKFDPLGTRDVAAFVLGSYFAAVVELQLGLAVLPHAIGNTIVLPLEALLQKLDR